MYDCLFPWTVGGAERYYRSLASAYAAAGHDVTYLTIRQWARSDPPRLPGVKVVAVCPPLKLYSAGKRRILPPLAFGLGVFLYLLARGRRFDLVHTASFPFFSVLAAGALVKIWRYRIAVDWHEVWTREYWRSYLGALGPVGWLIQRLCAAIPQAAFSFSRLHRDRAEELLGSPVTLLQGEYAGGPAAAPRAAGAPPEIVYAGRLIREKRVELLIDALAIAMEARPDLRARIIGRGPEFESIRARVDAHALEDRIQMPGFVSEAELDDATSRAIAIVQPSEREGYGMVVVEASARGVPVIVVEAPDNAATELISPNENGLVAKPTARSLAEAILACAADNSAWRQRSADWFVRNAERLSVAHSVTIIMTRLAQETERGGVLAGVGRQSREQ